MASTGKPSLVLVSVLILFLYSSKMACISSAEPPSNISKTKEKSSDDQVVANKKMVVEAKGTGLPKWHLIRGIKSSVVVVGSHSPGSPLSGAVPHEPWCYMKSSQPKRTRQDERWWTSYMKTKSSYYCFASNNNNLIVRRQFFKLALVV
ncbi:hypothetical protein ACOSP7_009114 [Xanthoceras sorbifolium]